MATLASHAARHPITLVTQQTVTTIRNGPLCLTCHEPIVWVESEIGRNSPHWRHKPRGYHWGDKVKRLRIALRPFAALDDSGLDRSLASGMGTAGGTITWAMLDTARKALRETR